MQKLSVWASVLLLTIVITTTIDFDIHQSVEYTNPVDTLTNEKQPGPK
ncbi:hypothetical protein [Paraliobacillus ryukyuensis]|nr:hypothetical protein [Paraliobacillus ryukyuensis]